MHDRHEHTPHIMAELFGRIPSDNPDFFIIRRLDMRGRKVEVASPPIESPVHCFFHLTEGEAMISVGKDLYFFQPGECSVIPAGQVFSIRYFDDCTGYMGGFSGELLSDNGQNPLHVYTSLRRWGYHKVTFAAGVADDINGIFRRLYAENETARNPKIIKAYLTALMTEIEETAGHSQNPVGGNSICDRFLELMFERYNQNRPLSHYASEMNISEEHLRKIVKSNTRKSPLEWINEARVLEAKSLLFNTDMTVSEISHRVGVDDSAYFSRLFKKNTGTNPAAYRSERKKSKTSPE